MKIYDISVPLGPKTPVYEGDPNIQITPHKSIEKGDSVNITLLSMGAHSGTHIDAPYHFDQKGERIDELILHKFIGPAQVIQAEGKNGVVTRDELMYAVKEDAKRILIKTPNSELWGKGEFEKNFISLSIEAANWIVNKRIKLVGIDYLSIERFHSADHEVHKLLLKNNIAIVEGLDLTDILPGMYNLICLPLKIDGGEASPARAVLTSI